MINIIHMHKSRYIIEFLAWMNSPVYAEHSDESFKNIDHKLSYNHFYALRFFKSSNLVICCT